jgi:hypothetical protein
MNDTESLDDDLVRRVRKLADEREALGRSFEELQFRLGKRDWARSDLYDRD